MKRTDAPTIGTTRTLFGERVTQAQYDAAVLRAAHQVGRDGYEFREYEVARWMYRAPGSRQFGDVAGALLRLAQAKASRHGRRLVWAGDDEHSLSWYMSKRGRRVRMSRADAAQLDHLVAGVRR